MEILEQKTKTSNIKKIDDRLKRRLEMKEERVGKLFKKRELTWRMGKMSLKNTTRAPAIWYYLKWSNVHVSGIPEGKERDRQWDR